MQMAGEPASGAAETLPSVVTIGPHAYGIPFATAPPAPESRASLPTPPRPLPPFPPLPPNADVPPVPPDPFAIEEALIVPILENDLPLGPLRAARPRQEHFEQRADLDALCRWPEDASDDERALRFDALGRSLLNDITHEERELLTPEIIRDDCIVIDQLGG